MALTPSNSELKFGSIAPDFALLEPKSGSTLSLNELKSDIGTVIMFICNHCPYVIHIAEGISRFAKDYTQKGISVIAINSNDYYNYPDDSPEKMVETIAKNDYIFPYLIDENQDVAKLYSAACTPDIFLFNNKMELVYHGQFDSSRPGNGIAVTGNDLRNAVDNLIANKEITANQIPSVGCNIKWK